MHTSQSLDVKVEQQEIMEVGKNLLDVQTNRPTMGIIQDSLLGAMMSTSRDSFLTMEEFMQVIGFCDNWKGQMPIPAVLKPLRLWTGETTVQLCTSPDQLRQGVQPSPDVRGHQAFRPRKG